MRSEDSNVALTPYAIDQARLTNAAKYLAGAMDYPWNAMPEEGRKRLHVIAEHIIALAQPVAECMHVWGTKLVDCAMPQGQSDAVCMKCGHAPNASQPGSFQTGPITFINHAPPCEDVARKPAPSVSVEVIKEYMEASVAAMEADVRSPWTSAYKHSRAHRSAAAHRFRAAREALNAAITEAEAKS